MRLTTLLLAGLTGTSFVTAAKTANDYFVTSLPGQPEGPLLRQYAGHIEVNAEAGGHLWFWKFENRHLANRHRTVLWLNGGPGCSSMDGALMEVGPYRLVDDSTLRYNNGSWDEFANLLFVDNPVGTGYSYVNTNSYVHELSEMASQMIVFLEKYFDLFPGESLNDLYIAGESYAGQHIPYIAQAILERNKKVKDAEKWNLSGLLIGNGWIAPHEQSLSYLEMGYAAKLVEKGSADGQELEIQQKKCEASLEQFKNAQRVSYPECEVILTTILDKSVNTGGRNGQCANMYDVRLTDTVGSCGMNWPPDLDYVKPYLRRSEVMQALHVDDAKKTGWVECNTQVGNEFRAGHSKPSIEILPSLIEAQVPVLLFSGDKDLICNHFGTEALISNMEWNGAKGFESSPGSWEPRRDWTFEGEPAGFYQSARNLTYVLFYNSSHMVPFDMPRRSRDMIDRFMGVDIASIGGAPAESRIDGEKMPQTSVGGHPNSTAAAQAAADKVSKAKWQAYYRSGAIALVVVIILAGFFFWYVWQDRRRRAGYTGLPYHNNSSASNSALALGGSSGRLMGEGSIMRRDVEEADFDENELDTLTKHGRGAQPGNGRHNHSDSSNRYSLGGFTDDDDDDDNGPGVYHDQSGKSTPALGTSAGASRSGGEKGH